MHPHNLLDGCRGSLCMHLLSCVLTDWDFRAGLVLAYGMLQCPLWVISGHIGLHKKACALALKADILGGCNRSARVSKAEPFSAFDQSHIAAGTSESIR